ncbi:MAG: hypothetical protein N3B21_13835 [Clostridia bacterium]|nr:hypothetical protein [Clostridia bacterium]
MQNHKKQDSISVNEISHTNEVRNISKKPVGNAGEDAFCVYDHKRHAVGSKIINKDGTETVCQKNGSWKNT